MNGLTVTVSVGRRSHVLRIVRDMKRPIQERRSSIARVISLQEGLEDIVESFREQIIFSHTLKVKLVVVVSENFSSKSSYKASLFTGSCMKIGVYMRNRCKVVTCRKSSWSDTQACVVLLP